MESNHIEFYYLLSVNSKELSKGIEKEEIAESWTLSLLKWDTEELINTSYVSEVLNRFPRFWIGKSCRCLKNDTGGSSLNEKPFYLVTKAVTLWDQV